MSLPCGGRCRSKAPQPPLPLQKGHDWEEYIKFVVCSVKPHSSMRLRLSYYLWLAVCMLALVILYHSHLKAVQSFSKSYQAPPKDDSQKSRAGYGTSTSSAVITSQEIDNVIFTESPPLNPNEVPAGSTLSDRIIVVGKLTSEDTTWVGEELSELVLRYLK